jgi:hypothetical protein
VTSPDGQAAPADRARRSVDAIIDNVAGIAVRDWNDAVAPSGIGTYSEYDLRPYSRRNPRHTLDLRDVAAQLSQPYAGADGGFRDDCSGWNRLFDEIAQRAQASTPDNYSGPGLRIEAVRSGHDVEDLHDGGDLVIALITGPDSGRYGRLGDNGLPASQRVFYPDASLGSRRAPLGPVAPGQQLPDAGMAARPSERSASQPVSTVAQVRSSLGPLVPKLRTAGKPRRESHTTAETGQNQSK